MGVKFRQSRETIHIAIEIVDRYYLKLSQEMIAKTYKAQLMHPAAVILHQVTALLISSKFDEIDDNITAIRDLREYVHKQVSQQQRRDLSLVPSFTQIVECERKLLQFFKWDLKFVLPLHIVRAFMANGVIFSNEFADVERVKSSAEVQKIKYEWSRAITTESLSISDLIVSKGNVSYRSESSSNVAASIIYLARKNILEADSPTGQPRVPNIWPQELVMMTRCTESKAKRILVDVLRPLDQAQKEESQALKILSKMQNVPNVGPKATRPPKYTSGNLISADKVLEKKALSRPTGCILSQQRMQQCNSSELASKNLLTDGQNEDTEISLRDKTFNPNIQNMLAMPAPTRYHAQSIKEIVKSSEGLKIIEDTIQERNVVSFVESTNTLSGTIAKAHSQRQILLPSTAINFQSTDLHDQQTRLLSRQLAEISSKQDSTQVQSPREEQEGATNSSKQLLALPNIPSNNTKNATAYQSIEKILEASHELSNKTASAGATTAFKSHCNGELGKSMTRPKDSNLHSTQYPFSSSKRPKNELGFRDVNNTEGRDKEISLNASNMEPVQTLPTEIKRLKKQPSVKTRKTLAKTKYVEVKRAQLAKIDSDRGIIKPIEKKKSQNKFILTGDNQVQSPVEAQRVILQYPSTAKHSSNPKINSFDKNGGQIGGDSNGFKKQGGNQLSNKAAPGPAAMSSQKQLCNLSSQSNEYFSVRPKMIDHVNQMAIQKEILRSGSIEYEVNQQLLEKSGGQQTALSPSEFNKQSSFRRSTVLVQGQNGFNVPASNLQGSSQVSFFKRPISDNLNGLAQSIHQNDKKQPNIKTQNLRELYDLDSSGQELQNTIGSGINLSSARDKNSRMKTHHMLPQIDGAMNQMNQDFSQAVEPFIKTSNNLIGTQQLKYLTKSSGTAQNASIRRESIAQGTMSKQQNNQSVRHLVQTSQDDKQALQFLSGATKTKNSIFGAQKSSATTKSINGFGPHQLNQPHPLNMTTKVYSINAIRKGPSFSQINQIATPTNILESASNNKVGMIHGNRILSNSDNQERSFANQKLNSGQHSNSMSSFQSNLISAQQNQLNRSSSNKTQPVSSAQLPSSTQRYMSGAAGSNTLIQLQADEAIANLKHHNQVQRGLVDKSGSVSQRAQLQQLSVEQKHQQLPNGHKQIAPLIGQRNQTQGYLSGTSKLNGQNSQSKILTVESNKQSTFISNRESSAQKIRNLNSGGRSQEALNSTLRQTPQQAQNNNVSQLRLRQFKSHVSQQDSKH